MSWDAVFEFLGNTGAAVVAEAGHCADFSIQSLAEIDRLIDEHTRDGKPVAGGYFDPDPARSSTGHRLAGLGHYVGEVLRRNYGGHWEVDTDGQPLPTGRDLGEWAAILNTSIRAGRARGLT